MRRIVILLHKHFTFATTSYFLREIAEVWKKMGLQITVLHEPGRYVDADLAILHVDLTTVPDDYLAFIHQYPATINGLVKDISKRRISSQLVIREGNYEGPVIVKTNLNCGGGSEMILGRKRSVFAKSLRFFHGKMPWNRRLKDSEYRIFGSANQVPGRIWNNPHLVVERFLPERKEHFYCLRTWFFLGDKETNSISYSNEPIIKSDNVLHREKVAEVPDELREVRRNLGFGYGKFDYAVVDGKVVLYDVNWTPTFGGLPGERALLSSRLLADGIRSFL